MRTGASLFTTAPVGDTAAHAARMVATMMMLVAMMMVERMVLAILVAGRDNGFLVDHMFVILHTIGVVYKDLISRDPYRVPMDVAVLREMGLSDSETRVYLVMLELSESTRGKIVDQSGIAGSKVYQVLARLQSRGLVMSNRQGGVLHFKASDPKQMLRMLEERRKTVERMEEHVTALLPQLLAKYESSKKEQEVELAIGTLAMEALFLKQVEDMRAGETCYVIGGTGPVDPRVWTFFQEIHGLRAKKCIKTLMVYSSQERSVLESHHPPNPLLEISYIPFLAPVAINIYHDKTIIIVFGQSVFSIVITSKAVTASFIQYFDLLRSLDPSRPKTARVSQKRPARAR
jgi:predicted transcriptional regulator